MFFFLFKFKCRSNNRINKFRKINIYFEVVLNINGNKCLVLIIVDIDERGFISYENPIIFSTVLDFDKTPSTIQKDIHTYISIEGLNNGEPVDNQNITYSLY